MNGVLVQQYRRERNISRVLSRILLALAFVAATAIIGLFAMVRYAEKPAAHFFFDEMGKPHCVAVFLPKEGRFTDCGRHWRTHRWQEVGPDWRVPRR